MAQIKDHVGLAAIVTQILDESGFEASLVCEFLGARKLANSRKLLLIVPSSIAKAASHLPIWWPGYAVSWMSPLARSSQPRPRKKAPTFA